MEENINFEVALGKGKVQKVEVKATIAVRTKNGQQMIINDVLYIMRIAQNLLSIGELLDKSNRVIFNVRKCSLIDTMGNIFGGSLQRHFYTQVSVCSSRIVVYSEDNHIMGHGALILACLVILLG